MMTILQSNPYDSVSYSESAGMLAMGTGTMVFILLVYLFLAYCLYRVFQKANYPQPIAAFVPIWNCFAMADVVKKPWWWGLLMCIPYVNIIILIFVYVRLAKFFDKSTGFAVGLILLTFIFLPILAFSDAYYHGNALPDDRK